MAVLPLQRSQPDFVAVYERHHQALYRYCRSILRHEQDAQDALQSTMARAISALQDERREIELRPWLFRIAHNEAVSILRRRRATAELDDAPMAGDLEDRVHEREELRALAADLAALPERQRAALVLRELNGLSHAEIGDVLELPPAAVKTAIFEARSTLCRCREARATACDDIRRMLSDGDGRVLRGRGVRAHLRACSDCRRFHQQLSQRPRKLAALAGPLPGAALLSQLLGGTAAKLLACAVLAGTSTTIAVEMRAARGPAPAVAATAAPPRQKPAPVPVASKPQSVPTATPHERARQTPRARGAKPATQYAAGGETGAPPAPRGGGEPKAPNAARTETGAPWEAKQHAADAPPAGQVTKPEETASQPDTPPPGQANKEETTAPGQAKKEETTAPGQTKPDTTPPGQAKRQATTPPGRTKPDTTPPGQLKRQDTPPPGQANKQDTAPPGQAKQDTAPPGQAKQDVTPPGQAKQEAVAAAQTSPAALAPGRAKKDEVSPGQAKKDDVPPKGND